MARLSSLLRRSESTGLDDALSILARGNVTVLTGAGVSTDSGIPDYRGNGGGPVRKPMMMSEFLASPASRRRYWIGATAAWRQFNSVSPNASHIALAQLQAAGLVSGMATQNIDRLHERAGSKNVVHIHGFVDKVVCLNCRQVYDREFIEHQLSELNPTVNLSNVQLLPDGDSAIIPGPDFRVPACAACAGLLKPSVVFFGESVPMLVFAQAQAQVEQADAVLIAGSSLAVNSGLRLVKVAKARKIPVIVINRGPTKADRLATVRLETGTSDFLSVATQRILDVHP